LYYDNNKPIMFCIVVNRLKKADYWLISTRLSGLILIAVCILQLWFFTFYRNNTYPIFADVFLGAMFLGGLSSTISVVNSWFYKKSKIYLVKTKKEPTVAVIIPTCGEDVSMVLKTLKSVILQNYPLKRLLIIISDDASNNNLQQEINRIYKQNPHIIYHQPPKKDSIFRLGEAKAGNLNSALAFVLKRFPSIDFIETRDADDLVGNPNFLRYTIGSMLADEKLSFVQTGKKAIVSQNDPFLNQEVLFYERTMIYRAAVNAAFPCGSGLVWRKSELVRLGGFPYWNLVEDLQSGFDILKIGGKGAYLPIVGAVGQIAPEDIPNFYKQRGTWAVDSLRLFFFDNALFKKRLTFFQKLQFFDTGFSYFLSLAIWIFVFSIASCLGASACATKGTSINLLAVNLLFVIFFEIFNFSRSRGSYLEIWKTRQTWIGLMPIFTISVFKSLFYGPNRKPAYRVTRKKHQFAFYWQEVSIQLVLTVVLLGSVISRLLRFSTIKIIDVILIFWALFLVYGFSRVIRNSVYGLTFQIDKLGFLEYLHFPQPSIFKTLKLFNS
jgi:cellulose synthase (UDP-forming)